jgi:anti-sigma factor RsiW
MTCDEARAQLGDYQRGRLPLPAHDALQAHLDRCPACARADAVEHELTALLEQRLPQHPASLALKRRLADQWTASAERRAGRGRWRRALVPALAVACVVLVAVPVLYYERLASRVTAERAGLVAEAVNDHLRLLASQHPLDIENGDYHRVKPWFAGRLDFAPEVTFEGDAEFPLKGGAVGYFRDRKAAVFVYARRLHPITLLVFRATGLEWPPRRVSTANGGTVDAADERGFTVLMWRRGELGYALVSDVDARELRELAGRLGAR